MDPPRPRPSRFGRIASGQLYYLMAYDVGRLLGCVNLGPLQRMLLTHVIEHSWKGVRYRGKAGWPDPDPAAVPIKELEESLGISHQNIYRALVWLREAHILIPDPTGTRYFFNKDGDEWMHPSTGKPLLSEKQLAYCRAAQYLTAPADSNADLSMGESPMIHPSENASESPMIHPSENASESPMIHPSEVRYESPMIHPSAEVDRCITDDSTADVDGCITDDSNLESPMIHPSEVRYESPMIHPSEVLHESQPEAPNGDDVDSGAGLTRARHAGAPARELIQINTNSPPTTGAHARTGTHTPGHAGAHARPGGGFARETLDRADVYSAVDWLQARPERQLIQIGNMLQSMHETEELASIEGWKFLEAAQRLTLPRLAKQRNWPYFLGICRNLTDDDRGEADRECAARYAPPAAPRKLSKAQEIVERAKEYARELDEQH